MNQYDRTFLTALIIPSTVGIAASADCGFALIGARIPPTRTIGPFKYLKFSSVAVEAISPVIDPKSGASSATTTRPNFFTVSFIASLSKG